MMVYATVFVIGVLFGAVGSMVLVALMDGDDE